MQKELTIARKDMTQSFRSLFAIMFMFVIPILMTGMFSLMFGSSDGEENEGFVLPITRVIVVNLDSGSFEIPGEANNNATGSDMNSIGQMLTVMLKSEGFADLMAVTQLENEAAAKTAVDNQEADVTIILPANLTATYLDSTGTAALEIYQDPTLTIGPAIIKGIVNQFLDGFAGSKITMAVTLEQLETAGVSLDEAQIQAVVGQYLTTLQIENGSQPTQATNLDIQAPKTEEAETPSESSNLMATMMAGMSIFYIFFTGASGIQSILTEEEKGTLPRLFTTPNSTATILRGKFLSVALVIIVQITVLLTFGYLVFKIDWGDLLAVILMSGATTLAATAFGVFLISWMKSSRQAGFMIGGLGTIFGMAGMMPTFTMAMPNPPAFIRTISLFTPHGWAADGFNATMQGGALPDILPNALALLGWTAILFSIGVIKFRKRYK
jgi:ABC-2 type transport system permease protein